MVSNLFQIQIDLINCWFLLICTALIYLYIFICLCNIFNLYLKKKSVQELEEPEDMSVYCVCVSRFYGLLSGNNRQSMVRFWDRRQTKIISTFYASQNNSSVYSLACTPDTVYAAWDLGLTAIELSSWQKESVDFFYFIK